jgi:hypothetical protein
MAACVLGARVAAADAGPPVAQLGRPLARARLQAARLRCPRSTGASYVRDAS